VAALATKRLYRLIFNFLPDKEEYEATFELVQLTRYYLKRYDAFLIENCKSISSESSTRRMLSSVGFPPSDSMR